MAWPNDRLTTYVPDVSEVKSADLNALQDAIIRGAHGDLTFLIPAQAAVPTRSAPNDQADDWTHQDGRWTYIGAGTHAFLFYPICLPVGAEIKAFAAWVDENGVASAMQAALSDRNEAAGTSSDVDSDTTAGAGAADPEKVSVALAAAETVLADHSYYVRVKVQPNQSAMSVQVTFWKP